MKVRWTSTSLRLRITPSELRNLVLGEPVEERFGVGSGCWSAVIVPDAATTGLTFAGGQVCLLLADADRARLDTPDCEGVYFQTDGTDPVRYYIEKDFPCVHPRGAEALEPETETFQAPIDFAARKN